MAFNVQSLIASNFYGWIIRAIQFAFTVINLGLSANTASVFSGGSIGWFIAVSVITLIYLAGLANVTHFIPQSIVPGAIIIIEPLIAIFWFTAFIAVAADYGGLTCSYYGAYYRYYYGHGSCSSAKAAIAFGLFNFLLFSLTSVIFGLTVIKPLVASKVNIWSPVKSTNVQLNAPVITLASAVFNVKTTDDVETGITNAETQVEREKTNSDENIEDAQNTVTSPNTITDEEPPVRTNI